MSSFATDRDLLVLEPDLLRVVGWSGQTLLEASGASIDASGLTLSVPGADLHASGIDAGSVLLVGAVAYEVVAVADAQTAVISRVRAGASKTLLPGIPGTGLDVVVRTFAPQIAWVHDALMRMIGIEPGPSAPGEVGASDVTNGAELARLEALGALHVIYSAASLGSAEGDGRARAEMYRVRFAVERARTGARIDLDGDGEPDAIRRFGAFHLVRV